MSPPGNIAEEVGGKFWFGMEKDQEQARSLSPPIEFCLDDIFGVALQLGSRIPSLATVAMKLTTTKMKANKHHVRVLLLHPPTSDADGLQINLNGSGGTLWHKNVQNEWQPLTENSCCLS